MAADRRTRESITDQLKAAKRAAASWFLVAVEPAVRATASAVSTRPQYNVVGVGLGPRIRRGRATRERCVRIYVERKVARGAIPAEFVLPESIEGVGTDVIETGRFRALPAAVPIARRRLRPARPGCSVGFQFTGDKRGLVMAGTFGALVEADGARFILSNNHVLAEENALPAGSPIFQPGLLDLGDPNRDQIARLTRFAPLRAGSANTVDCAIAQVIDPQTVRATVLPRVGRLRSPSPAPAAEDMRVHKHGRTTGYTTGTVFDVSADVSVQYDSGVMVFHDQMLVRGGARPFSAAGDSGSLIVDRTAQRAIGLLFAGSDAFTIANHLSDVFAALQVTLVV